MHGTIHLFSLNYMIVNYCTVILLNSVDHIHNVMQYLILFTLYRQVCQLLKRNANQNSADDQGQVRLYTQQ